MTFQMHISGDDLVGENALGFLERLSRNPLDPVRRIELRFDERAGLDASGVAVLVRLYSHAVRTGRELKLSHVPAHVLATLTEVGLRPLLTIDSNTEPARVTDGAPQPV